MKKEFTWKLNIHYAQLILSLSLSDPRYSIILNSEQENINPNIINIATTIPAPPIIAACDLMKSDATSRHPFEYKVNGDGASMHGFRCPPYVSWQHDSGIRPDDCQSRHESTPQHLSRVCVWSQDWVTARRLPYNFSDEYISCRMVTETFSRNT